MADVDPGPEPNHHPAAAMPEPEQATVNITEDEAQEAPPMLTSDKPTLLSEKAKLQQVKEQDAQEIQNDRLEEDGKQTEAEGPQQAADEQDEDDEVKPEVPPKDAHQDSRNGSPVEQQGDAAPPAILEPEPTDDNAPSDTRMRSDSRSTTATFATHRSTVVSSTVFIVTALEAIGASRDARRNKELEDAVQVALANVRQTDGQPIDPELIFRPLHLASKTLSIPLQVTSLDCIGKLITYSYFAFPSAETESEATPEKPPLIERADRKSVV